MLAASSTYHMPARGGGGAPPGAGVAVAAGMASIPVRSIRSVPGTGVARFPFRQPMDYGTPGADQPLIDPAPFVGDYPGQCRFRRRPARAQGCSGRWVCRLPQPGSPADRRFRIAANRVYRLASTSRPLCFRRISSCSISSSSDRSGHSSLARRRPGLARRTARGPPLQSGTDKSGREA